MKAKFEFLPLYVIFAIAAGATGAQAQVGGLTRTGNITVCQGSTSPFGVIPTAGSSYVWSLSAGSGGAGTVVDGPSPNNLISVMWTSPGTCLLQVIEISGACSGTPVTIEVTVLPGLLPGTASGDQSICFNTLPNPVTATPPAGENGTFSFQWEFSPDGGQSWLPVSGATALTYQPGALTLTTSYRLQQVSGGGCGTVTTNRVTITVQPELITSPIYHQ